MRRNLYITLLLLTCAVPALSQETRKLTGAQTLRLARSFYEQGRLHDIPELFRVNDPKGFGNKDEATQAYKLLTLTYIYLEEPDSADAAMLNLLNNDHYFKINLKDDPAEFVALYRTFRTDPIYRLGVKLGANAAQPTVLSFIPASDGTKKYSYGISFQGGVAFEIPLNVLRKKVTFAPELNLMLRNFKYENIYKPVDAATNEEREYVTNGTENQAWISLPLLLQYELLENKKETLRTFISLGVSPDYLLSARNTYLNTKEQAPSLQEQTADQKPYRSSINISAVASAGARLAVKGGYAIAEVRYMYALNQSNDISDIYAQQSRTFDAQIVDGIFRTNSVNITVGYVYNIFKPKKLNR